MTASDGYALCKRETRFADITLPADRMTGAQGVFDASHERVDGQIHKFIVHLVVGHFEHKLLIKG